MRTDCSTKNSTQCSVVTLMGKKSQKGGIYMYGCSWFTALQLKLTHIAK